MVYNLYFWEMAIVEHGKTILMTNFPALQQVMPVYYSFYVVTLAQLPTRPRGEVGVWFNDSWVKRNGCVKRCIPGFCSS